MSRNKQSRQIYLHEVFFAVNGTAGTPAASGLDSNFIESVTDHSAGNYTITFKDKAQRSIIPYAVVCTTASRVCEVVSVSANTIRLQFRNLSGVAADADFNCSVGWHGSQHLF